MNARDATVPPPSPRRAPAIAALVDDVAARLAAGGRLVYVGAGTSGRLAALDAAECEPTFGSRSPPLVAERTSDEDDAPRGAARRGARRLGADAVVGVSASGRSPFVVAALEAARSRGALTGCIVCVDGSSSPRSPTARCASRSAPR
jgi:N-acetylmuramic acid 6-phosphate etherase